MGVRPNRHSKKEATPIKKVLSLALILVFSLTLLPMTSASAAKTLPVTYEAWLERFTQALPLFGYEGKITFIDTNTPIQGVTIYEGSGAYPRPFSMRVYVDTRSKKVLFANAEVSKFLTLEDDVRAQRLETLDQLLLAIPYASNEAFTEENARAGFAACDFVASIDGLNGEKVVKYEGISCTLSLDGRLQYSVGGNK